MMISVFLKQGYELNSLVKRTVYSNGQAVNSNQLGPLLSHVCIFKISKEKKN